MLVYKALQVVSVSEPEFKDGVLPDGKTPWKNVTQHVTALGAKGGVAVIAFKRKTAEELKLALAPLVIGKPAEIPVISAVPMFAKGSTSVAGYQYAA